MAIYTAPVAASADDAYQYLAGGTMDVTGNVMNVNGTNQYAGMRFLNVTIANAATITSATIDLYITTDAYDDPDLIIYCEDSDDAAAFTATNLDISNRTPTTATTAWQAAAIGAGTKSTPNFATSVKEVVDRVGWASGNDLVVIFKGDDAATLLRFATYDSSNPEAVLTIVHGAAAGGAAVKTMHYKGQRL